MSKKILKEIKRLEDRLEGIVNKKNAAIAKEEYEKAAALRGQEIELEKKIKELDDSL